MPKVTFAVGATADIASSSDVKDMGDTIAKAIGRNRDPRPLYNDVASSAVAVAGIATRLEMGGPASGRVWDLRQLVLAGADDSSAYSAWTVSTVGVAALTGNAALPAGQAIAGFDIEFGPAVAAVTGVVTVTGTIFGTLPYTVSEPTGGGALSIRFPEPIPPLNAATSIAVMVPAITGGAAYTIDAYGVVQAAWYKSMSDTPGLAQLLVPRGAMGKVPGSVVPASSKSIFLHYGEELTALVYGVPAAGVVTGIARIAEWPDGSMESRII